MTLESSDRIPRLNKVRELTGLSRSTLYRKVQAARFRSRSSSPSGVRAGACPR